MTGESYRKAAVTLCNVQRNRKSATETTRTALTWLANTKKERKWSPPPSGCCDGGTTAHFTLGENISNIPPRRSYKIRETKKDEVSKLRGESAVARATSSFLHRPELTWGGWTSRCISVILLVAAASRCRPIFTTTQAGLQLAISFGVRLD